MIAITCPALSTPQNGNPPSCTNNDNFGSVCTFTCMTGYGIVGDSTSTCTGDGSSKDGSYDKPAPTCEGNYIFILLKILLITLKFKKSCFTKTNEYCVIVFQLLRVLIFLLLLMESNQCAHLVSTTMLFVRLNVTLVSV